MSTNDEIQDFIRLNLLEDRKSKALSYAAGMLNEIAMMGGDSPHNCPECSTAVVALRGILLRLKGEYR